MKLNTRRRIFYVFLLLFFVIGAVVILYAEGWRLNPVTLDAEKAGGVYVRSYPDNAAITLDGKSIPNQSAFLSRGTFISGLFPKTYVVQLKAAGYDSWSEDAQVVPSLVVEMQYAVLVPQKATNVATSTNVHAFFEVNGELVTQTASGTLVWNDAMISNGTVVSHSTDLKTAIIRSANAAGTAEYSFYDFPNATSTALTPLLQQLSVTITPQLNIFIDPNSDTSIIVQTSHRIIVVDTATQKSNTIETAPTGEIIGSQLALSPSVIAWYLYSANSNASQVMVYDKFSGNITDSSLTVTGAIKQLTWIKSNSLGVLENNNSLFIYTVSDEQLSKLADDVKQFYPTDDGNAVAVLEYNSLEVFDFGMSQYYRFALPNISSVQGLIWYKDENHLFVIYPTSVSFLDFADTNLKNFITVSQGTQASYDAEENSLYLIDPGQKLLRFDFPQ